jgi:hypothetical protein
VAAARRLVGAHVALGRAEFGEIMAEVRRMAALAGVAIGALIVLGFFLPIGTSLFLGDWLFGSLGWGVLHGSLFLVGVAIAALVVAVGVGGGSVARDLGIAVVLGVVVGVLFGLNLSNLAWARLGEQVAPTVSAEIRPLVLGGAGLAVVGAVLGLLLGSRGGMGGAIGGLVGGAIAGLAIGALSAVALGPQVGAAIGVTVALIAWPALVGWSAVRQGIDGEALAAKFTPTHTIEMTKETIEWVRTQTPLGPKS